MCTFNVYTVHINVYTVHINSLHINVYSGVSQTSEHKLKVKQHLSYVIHNISLYFILKPNICIYNRLIQIDAIIK